MAAGVSIATVSRVMNDNSKVDPALVQKVMREADRLGYGGGTGMRRTARGRIAVVVPALGTDTWAEMVEGVIETAHCNGQAVIVMVSNGSRDKERECLCSLLSSPVEGIVFAGGSNENPLDRFPALRGCPMVIAGRRHVSDRMTHVYADNENAGYLVVKYLFRLQRRRIALFLNCCRQEISDYESFLHFFARPEKQGGFDCFDRFAGYARAFEEEGLTVDPNLICFCGDAAESGYQTARDLLANPWEFDAILVPHCHSAVGVLRLLREQGIQVPEQVSLACFNIGSLAAAMTPSLTGIMLNYYEMGCQAAQQLNELIQGRPAKDVKVDVRLAINGSTAHGRLL